MTDQETQQLALNTAFIEALKSSNTIPAEVRQAFIDAFIATSALALSVASGGTGAVTLTGILLGNGTSAITGISQLSGTKVYYVSDSSGGAVNRKLTFSNGVLISET